MATALFKTFRDDAGDRDYWLSQCEGYRVESSGRRIGTVQTVRYGSRADRPDTLVARTGFLGRKTMMIPVAEVIEVIPREQRIVVA